MFKLLDSESIKKQIGSVGKAGARLVAAIQTVAVQVLAHAVKHGDVTLARELVAAVPGKFRASLVAWMEVNGPFAFDKETKTLNFYKDCKALAEAGIRAGAGEVSQEYVDALPRWEAARKDPPIVSEYDMSEECSKFFGRMRKLAGDGKLKNKQLLMKLVAVYNREVAGLDESNIDPAHVAGTPEAAEQDRLATTQFGPVAVNQ